MLSAGWPGCHPTPSAFCGTALDWRFISSWLLLSRYNRFLGGGGVSSVAASTEQPVTVPNRTSFLRSTAALKLALGLLLVSATVALYYPVGHFQFVNYDDDVYVTDNVHVKYGLGWEGVKWAFTSYEANNWHPLTWLSHMLDCRLFFINAGRHHDVNLLLHTLNAGLLFWVLLGATGYIGRSFLVAALFALHPINVESVAWVSERKNLLSMLFFLLALGAYGWYARWAPQPSRRGREAGRLVRYLAVVVLFALGLMAKPQIVTLPFVLLLWDYWPLRREPQRPSASPESPVDAAPASVTGRGAGWLGDMLAGGEEASPGPSTIPARSFTWLLLEKLPLLLLVLASSVLTLQAESTATMPYPLSVRVGNAIVSYLWYIGKAFWPSRLALFYPHPAGLPPLLQIVAGALCMLAVTVVVIAGARRHRYLLVGWLWFVGTLVPMIGLVQVGRQAMADRYAYLSFIGLFIMVCWGVAEWSDHLHLRPAWLWAASVVVLLALAVVSHRQIGYWRDSYSLWSRSLQVTGPNDVAESDLGVMLMNEGRLDEALPHLRRAVALKPLSPINNLNLGICEAKHGDLPEAIEHLKTVLNVTQDDVANTVKWRYDALKNMSAAYHELGDSPHAYQSLEEAKALLRKYGRK
jgi:hypothetical protein